MRKCLYCDRRLGFWTKQKVVACKCGVRYNTTTVVNSVNWEKIRASKNFTVSPYPDGLLIALKEKL